MNLTTPHATECPLPISPSRQSGRAGIPVLLAALGFAFVIAIAYQVGQTQPTPQGAAGGAKKTPPPAPANIDGSVSDGGIARSGPAKERPTTGTPAGNPSELDAGIAQVIADLADFRLRTDYELLMTPEGARGFEAARKELLEYLKALDPAFAGPVVEFLETADNHLQRRVLLEGLGIIGGDIATEGLADHYETWSSKDRTANGVGTEIKYTAIALGAINSDFSYDILNHYVRDGDQQDRSRFVEQLGLHGRRKESVPLFTELAAQDDQIRVRNKAAQALKRTADHGSAARLEELVQSEQVHHVRQTMIGALGAIGDPGSLKTLDRILREDENPTTRMSATNSAARIGGPEAKAMIERVAANDTEARVRSFAKQELEKMADRGN